MIAILKYYIYFNVYQVLFINYVRDSVNLNNTTYRLLKPIVLKVQLAGPRELYKLRFINVSALFLLIFSINSINHNSYYKNY